MDWVQKVETEVTHFLISLTVPIVLLWLFSASRKARPVTTDDGGCILAYAKPLKWFGLAVPAFMMGGLVSLIVMKPIESVANIKLLLFVFLFVSLAAVYFYIEFFTVKIRVGLAGIEGYSWWRGRRRYTWSEIEKITYSPWSMWFKVSAGNKAPLRIHAMVSGIPEFKKCFLENLPEEKWVSADEKSDRDDRING